MPKQEIDYMKTLQVALQAPAHREDGADVSEGRAG
jgi:hypothetical protein